MKGLEQRRIQPRIGAKVNILPSLAGNNLATEPLPSCSWLKPRWSTSSSFHPPPGWGLVIVQSLTVPLWLFMSNSLQPQGLQHTRLPCPSPSPGVRSDSCPLSRWCHQTISSSVTPFSCCLQSFPASESFPESALHIWWPNYWDFSFSISPSNEYSRLISFRIDWFNLLAV